MDWANSTEFLNTGPYSEHAEDKVIIFSTVRQMEMRHWEPGTVFYFYPNISYQYTLSSHTWVHRNAFLVTPWKDSISTSNKTIKKPQSEIKTTISEIKNALEGINSRLHEAKDSISNLENNTVENTLPEQQIFLINGKIQITSDTS